MLKEKTVATFDRPSLGATNPGGADVSIDLDAGSPSEPRDLGRLLADALGRSRLTLPYRVRGRVRGTGRLAMTPVSLPRGLSLDLVVDPPAAGAEPLTLAVAEGATGDALLAAHDASLSMTGARLALDARAPGVRALVAVDHGNLSLDRCILTGPAQVEDGGGLLVLFRTDGTRPFVFDPKPTNSVRPAPGRPACRLKDCVLISGADAIEADVGRGLVELTNCGIAAGGSALVLEPQKVARGRFEADLRLDRCTVVAEQALVTLRAWPGADPGPDRPWVVSSRNSAFLDAFEHPAGVSTCVLLRSDPLGLSRGALAWDSSGDVFDVTHFTAGGDGPPAASARPDVQQQWVDLWGPSHVRGVRGPRLGAPGPILRPRPGRLRPGAVAPADLALTVVGVPASRPPDVGADPSAWGLSPAR